MNRCAKFTSVCLLAVFGLGGLIAPMVHRIGHVHDVEHRHGAAAADVTTSAAHGSEFLVEEQTPPDELDCDLCARLSIKAFAADVHVRYVLATASFLHVLDAAIPRRASSDISIRGPPRLI